jgi:hypothetical protein
LTINNWRDLKHRSSIFDWIQELPREYGNYTGDIDNLVLKDVEARNLLRLKGDADDSKFKEHRSRLPALLDDLFIMINYNDIYDKPMPTYTKSFA